MKKFKEFIYYIYSALSGEYFWRVILFRVFLLNSTIIIIFVLMFCIVGYEETFQITANAHLNLLDDRKRAIRFVKYMFTIDFLVDLQIFLKESLIDASSDSKTNDSLMSASFLLCCYVLVNSMRDNGRD